MLTLSVPRATWMLKVSMEMQKISKKEKLEQQQQKQILEVNEEVSVEDVEIRRLIEKENTAKGEKRRLKELDKQIRKYIRDKKRTKRQEKYSKNPTETRSQSGTKSAKKRIFITKMKNEKGEVITSRKGIASAFGEFYSKLYDDEQHEGTELESNNNETENNKEDQGYDVEETRDIPEVTNEELQAAISTLKKKANQETATEIRAEDIKTCDEETKEMVRQTFNEVLKQKDCTPEAWQRKRIKVIHKKGDVEDVGNYRPICSLPALYTLFTTVLCSRRYPRLIKFNLKIRQGSDAHIRQWII